jgi:tungstate transport system permease protein
MEFIGQVLSDALEVLSTFGPELRQVLLLTLVISLTATLIGVILGVPLGTVLALGRFSGRRALQTLVNVGMGIPPVLVGLLLLLIFWNSGPLGGLNLVFTPTAMVIAQVMLALPIAAGVTAGAVGGMPSHALEQLEALRLPRLETGRLAVSEARTGVAAAVVASFGRVIAEVGAVLIIGGSIAGETQVLTTLIVQESRQARFGAAVAAGIVLLLLSLAVNLFLGRWGQRPLGP